MKLRFALLLLGPFATGALAAEAPGETLSIARFSDGSLAGWEKRAFKGETRYAFVRDDGLKTTVLEADADASASGLYRKIKIDLTRTPYINWSWKATSVFPDINENIKAGDDFPARVYVVVERGVLGMGSLSVNYVWASQHPVGSLWPSPFTAQVKLLALDSGSQSLGQWVRHKRDLRADLKSAFGQDIAAIDAVALMTDTDNHGGHARTFYGDIWFSEQ